jgi:hypothetical protein
MRGRGNRTHLGNSPFRGRGGRVGNGDRDRGASRARGRGDSLDRGRRSSVDQGGGHEGVRSQSGSNQGRSGSSQTAYQNPIARLALNQTELTSANFFGVITKAMDIIYRYDLNIEKVLTQKELDEERKDEEAAKERKEIYQPRDLPARVKKRVVFLLIKAVSGKAIVATDFKTHLLSIQQLQDVDVPMNPGTSSTCRLRYYEEDERGPNQKSHEYVISITLQKVSMDSLFQSVTTPLKQGETPTAARDRIVGDKNEVESILNVLISHRPNQCSINSANHNLIADVACIGQHKFYRIDYDTSLRNKDTPPWKLPSEGLEAIPGYFRSIRVASEGRIMLNINTATSAFYPSGLLSKVISGTPFGKSRRYLRLQRYLKGMRVRTTHLRNRGEPNEMTWTISGLPNTHDPTAIGVTFALSINPPGPANSSSSSASIVQSQQTPPALTDSTQSAPLLRTFLEQFNLEYHGLALDPGDFIVVCGRSKCVPARYLKVLPGQFYKQKADMVKQAARNPDLNSAMITTAGLEMFGLTNRNDLHSPVANFALDVERSMTKVGARLLPQPSVSFARTQVDFQDADNGKWNLRNHTFAEPVQG